MSYVEISKLDEDRNLVFGWANIALTNTNETVVDAHDHSIAEEDLETAAYIFNIASRESGEMHQGEGFGELIESVVFTDEKIEKMGLDPDSVPRAWWIGFRVPPEVFAKVKSGELSSFSIQGLAQIEEE